MIERRCPDCGSGKRFYSVTEPECICGWCGREIDAQAELAADRDARLAAGLHVPTAEELAQRVEDILRDEGGEA